MKNATLFIFCIASVGLTLGCASQKSADATIPQPRYYLPISASALAFDPPIASETPMPDLSRQGRSTAAFAGYEQNVTTSTYVHQRDEIRFDTNGRFERTAYSDTTSTISR